MPLDDPGSWAQAAGAIKATVDSVRTAWGLIKDFRSNKGDEHNQKEIEKQIDNALATATSSAAVADVEIKKALGYKLCYCEFPPTAMLTVGYYNNAIGPLKTGEQVVECPKCGLNNAGGFIFQRTKKHTDQ